jgi:hypothetical protein
VKQTIEALRREANRLGSRGVTVLRVNREGLATLGPMNTHGTSSLLGRREAATRLACSLATLDRLVRAGSLPVVYLDRRPRYLAEDVAALVHSRRSKWSECEVAPDAIYEPEHDQKGASDD